MLHIYLDTVLWNELCDQHVSAADLVSLLAGKGAQLVLSTQVVYEMAKTFQMNVQHSDTRGRELFSYMKHFVQMRIPCLRMTSDILGEEIRRASRKADRIDMLLGEQDYESLVREIDKLAAGIFDERADQFIHRRKEKAIETRSDIADHFRTRIESKSQLAAIPPERLGEWLRTASKRLGRTILKSHIGWTFPNIQPRDAAWAAKKLHSSPIYRLSHAMIRADLYINWRYVQVASVSRDVPDDLYHVVNASHCDIYATKDKKQGKYAPMVLTKCKVLVYDSSTPLGAWVSSLPGKLIT